MEIARIEVGRTTGTCTRRGRIPAGIVGASVQVSFTDPVWHNLIKTVVFRGKETRIAEFDGAVAVIPHEVVAEPGGTLYFGIFGHDPDSDLQIPLIEVRLGITEAATDANADPGTDPTLPIWAQLQQEIEEIKQQGPGSGGGDIDLTGYATEAYVQDYAQPKGDYPLRSELPSVPVKSVNGKTGAVTLSASDVAAEPKGTAASAVSSHNTSNDSHNDLRLELKAINDRLTAFFDSDNQTLDELSEIVAYITSNKSLIDAITTSKVSVADIINNLTTNVTNKPLSAAQGVALKGLIDGVSNSLANYQPKGNYVTKEDSEEWVFTLADGSTVTKAVFVK